MPITRADRATAPRRTDAIEPEVGARHLGRARAGARCGSIDAANDELSEAGPWVQVSRLGNPLFNEVIVPLGQKDAGTRASRSTTPSSSAASQHPELARLLPVLYPGVFPNLAGSSAPRADLVAILLTGIPAGIVPGFQNYTRDRCSPTCCA